MERLLIQMLFSLFMLMNVFINSEESENKFSRICFQKDNLCYYYKNEVTSYNKVSDLERECPKGTHLITVFNKTIQYHLQTIINKLVDESEFSKVVLSLKYEKALYWMFGKESRVPVSYGNWRGESYRMGEGDCVFVSEAYGFKWQISSCGGLAMVVCMSKMCNVTWETLEGSESNFERGSRVTSIGNIDDCKLYCEMLESACIGVYMSYWSHCWHYPIIISRKLNSGGGDGGDDGGELRKLYLKSSKSVCPSKGYSEAADGSHVWVEDSKEGRVKRQANDSSPQTSSRRPPAGGTTPSSHWFEEPSPDEQAKSSLEKVYTMMSIFTFSIILGVVSIRIITWILIKLKKKKEKVAEEAAN